MNEKIRGFECKRCGYRFSKQHAALVEKCYICAYPVFDHDLEHPFPGITLSEQTMLQKLDPYARMKYMWYKYPKYHDHIIQTRKVVGDKTYLMDSTNTRIGEMPEVVV